METIWEGRSRRNLALIFEFIDRSLTVQRYSKRRKRNVSSGTKDSSSEAWTLRKLQRFWNETTIIQGVESRNFVFLVTKIKLHHLKNEKKKKRGRFKSSLQRESKI